MADFVAVLRKTLDGLSDPSPQMREKVYEKARATIAGKLAAMNPPPAAGVVERQKQALEEAIVEIEKGFAPPPPPRPADDPLAELENVFASLKSPDPLAGLKQPRAAPGAVPSPGPKSLPRDPVQTAPPPVETAAPAPVALRPDPDPGPPEPRAGFYPPPDEGDADDLTIPETSGARRSRARGAAVAASALALLVAAGAGYGVWINRDAFGALFGSRDETAAPVETPAEPVAATPPAEMPADAAAAPQTPASDTPPPAAEPDAAALPKFTQRLNSDGTEIEEGPAATTPVIGEGTSIAAVTQPPLEAAPTTAATPPADPAPQPDAPAADAAPVEPAPLPAPATAATEAPETPSGPAASPTESAVPVGQRAIFYEERTNVADASAAPGTIVWSLVQESPGGDLPPEPAIRAEATIPGKDLQLRMTIRRNADRSLPASHIVEMIFLTPQGFEGGGIENVLRLSLKGSEQEAGSPLLGIPAKIADGFFLIALNDTKPEIDANLTLMRRQSWIDVPIQYKSGRRALFTMEKGIPGAKVFDEALKAWQAASSG